MISLATFDGAETGAAAPREPSITSIHRLAAFAAPDRNGLAPIGASGNSADAGLGQLATGQNAPTETRATTNPSPAAHATALFKSLGPELEKFRQTGRNQMQLDIPVGENESVRIRLSLRAGELRSTFITESPELREALQKAWPEFAQTSRDRGVRLGDPSFQQGFQGNDSAFGQNARRDQSSTGSDQTAFPASRKSAPTRSSSNQTSTALWA
jgi:flagellar hook-length control protein FliK